MTTGGGATVVLVELSGDEVDGVVVGEVVGGVEGGSVADVVSVVVSVVEPVGSTSIEDGDGPVPESALAPTYGRKNAAKAPVATAAMTTERFARKPTSWRRSEVSDAFLNVSCELVSPFTCDRVAWSS
jgi:hypothetical protein